MSIVREEITVGAIAIGHPDGSRGWPVRWSAIWVGALASIALVLIFGLLGIALGAHPSIPVRGYTSWKGLGLGTVIMSVLGAFLASAAGGWVAGKITGMQRSEDTMLHAAIAWLVAVPMLMVLAPLGAAAFFGPWYSGLVGVPAWVAPPAAPVPPEAIEMARNGAIGALAALLVSLVGSVIGGWMASGEPMTLTHYRTRERGMAGHPASV